MRIFAVFFAIIFVLTATSAAAVTLRYNFQDNLSDNETSISYIDSISGVKFSVTSYGGRIHRAGNGIGVRGRPEGSRIAAGERLTFTFDSYRIDSFTATIWERGSDNEQFIFGFDGEKTAIGGTNGVSLQLFTASLLNETSSFTVQGLEQNGPGNRGIKIANIEVELSEIPLPASSGLLLTGILALRLYKSRKS